MLKYTSTFSRIVVVQLLSCVQLFATPQTTALQTYLYITNCWSLLKLMSIEFEQAVGDSEGQGSLVCCSPWGCEESDTTE